MPVWVGAFYHIADCKTYSIILNSRSLCFLRIFILFSYWYSSKSLWLQSTELCTAVTKRPEMDKTAFQKCISAFEVCGVCDIVAFGDPSANAEVITTHTGH